MKSGSALAKALLLIAACLLRIAPTHAADANYPERPVTLVVPYAAGGPSDVAARVIGEALTRKLGERFIVENRTGASGSIGVKAVKNAAPDGYTLLFGSDGLISINPELMPDIGYSPLEDFQIVSIAVSGGCNVLVVHPGLASKDLKSFVEAAKNGNVSFGSAGQGTPSETAAIEFQHAANIKLTKVPYRGSGPALQDVVAGHVNAVFVSAVSAVEQIRSGTVRALAVTSRDRCDLLPEVPSMSELGYPLDTGYYWYGLFAPAKTPGSVLDKINSVVSQAAKDPDFARQMKMHALAPLGLNRSDSLAFVQKDIENWRQKIRSMPEMRQ